MNKKLALSLGIFLAFACKKNPSTPPATAPTKSAELPMPALRLDDASEKTTRHKDTNELDARLDEEAKLAETHRRTMITPAPADFKPESVARKVQLKLFLLKAKIRTGEPPQFRLEMTNTGREAIDYVEYRSSVFVKDAGAFDTLTMHFYLTDSRGKRTKLHSPAFAPKIGTRRPSNKITGPPNGLSEAEKKKWFVDTNAGGQARSTFKVKLLPGETLHSIGDDAPPRESFKALVAEDLEKPGAYRLHVELDDRPEPLDQDYIEFSLKSGSTLAEVKKQHADEVRNSLGPVSSNAVTFEITP